MSPSVLQSAICKNQNHTRKKTSSPMPTVTQKGQQNAKFTTQQQKPQQKSL